MTNVEVDEAYKLKKKSNNGLVYGFYWWVGYKFAYFFKFLGVKPNLVSVFSLMFYVSASYFFIQTNTIMNVIGGFLFYLGVQMDATDGKLARLTNNTSQMGIWLDYNFDYLRPLFIYPSIGLKMFYETNQTYWLIIAFVALAAIYVFTIISMRWDMFNFAGELKEKHVEESKHHKYLKQFYFYEGIEPLFAILCTIFFGIEYYLIFWTLWLIAMYLASAFVWGREINKRDKASKN